MFRRVNCHYWVICLLLLTSPAIADPQPEELLTAASQAFHNGFSDVTIRYCEDFLQQFPDDPKVADIKFLLGQSYYLRNRYHDALAAFQSLSSGTTNQDGVTFWLGECYLKLKQNDLAKEQYNQVINHFGSSTYAVSAMYSLGWLYLEQRNYSLARQTFERLFTAYPANPLAEDSWLKASEAALNANDWTGAVNLLKRYLASYPQTSHQTEVFFNLGECYYNLENYPQALESYQKAVVTGNQPAIKLSAYIGQLWSLSKLNKVNDLQGLAKTANALAQQYHLPNDDLLMALGSIFFEAGDYASALANYEEFIRTKPGSPQLDEAYLGRANIFFAMKRFDEAAQDYRRLLDIPDSEIAQKAHFGLGWLLIKQGHADQAFPYFKSVVEKSDDPVIKSNALLQMADAYQDVGQLDQALDQYQHLINDNPDLSNKDYVIYRMAMAYLKNDQPDNALKKFDELKSEFPQSVYLSDMNYYQGVAAFKKGDWAPAALAMENFLKGLTKPSDFTPQANYIMGISLMNVKQTDEALKIFQKILRLYPENTVVAKNADLGIARCYVDLDQPSEAQKRFKIIVFKYPKSDAAFEGLVWLGKNELKNNNPTQAVAYYQQAVDGYPGYHGIETVYYELAQAYELLGDTDHALQMYRRVTIDEALTAKAQLAMAELMAKDINANQAIDAYQRVINSYPDYAREASIRLGQLYRNMQQYEKEYQVYTNALKLTQGKSGISNAQLQFSLADTLELMSRMEEAIEQYLAIGQMKEQDNAWMIKAYLRVAKIYEDNHDWQAARLTYQKIVSFNTDESKYAQERLDWIKTNTGHKN